MKKMSGKTSDIKRKPKSWEKGLIIGFEIN